MLCAPDNKHKADGPPLKQRNNTKSDSDTEPDDGVDTPSPNDDVPS